MVEWWGDGGRVDELRRRIMTICKECVHHEFLGSSWNRQFCKHPNLKREETRDCVTGKLYPVLKSSSGGMIRALHSSPYCRDINMHGECELYEGG